MRRCLLPMMILMLVATSNLAAGDGDELLGLWATDPDSKGGLGHVEVTKRGDKYYGTIVWLEEAVYPPDDPIGTPGEPKVDYFNPDPDLRDAPVVGLEIFKDFVYKGDGVWHKGTIYDPNNGKTYKCKMRFGENDRVLKVRGYIGVSMIGRTTVWTRVEGEK